MPQIYGKINRAMPAKTADASQLQPRLSGYGEVVTTPLSPTTYPLADEGSYFKATNATVGTGIIHALTTAFSATACLFTLFNTEAEGAKRIYLDYVRLITGATAIGMTAATSIESAITIDSTNRYSAGGTTITPKNVNMDASTATVATLNFGAVTAAAASGSVRQVARQAFPRRAAPAMVTGDQFYWDFGVTGTSPVVSVAGAAAPATAATSFYTPMSPVVIGGGDTIIFHLWYPAGATTAPTYEFEIGWWER